MTPILLLTLPLPLEVSQDISAVSNAMQTADGCITKYMGHELQP